MIDLYTWKTPNGRKVSVFLEEAGLPYRVHAVDISQGEQALPEFLKISPNGKIPAIVDDAADGAALAIFESGVILTYLADKTGLFLAKSGAARYHALAWMTWQLAGLGPMMGQLGYFSRQPVRNEAAIARYATETGRLLHVLETRLLASAFLGGEAYGIADMAAYPWVSAGLSMMRQALPEDARELPATANWLQAIGARPAVQRGMVIPA